MSAVLARAQRVPYPRGASACRDADPEIFFPLGNGDCQEARALCRPCDVRDDCLEYALAWDVHGIWGGTTYQQRKEIRAARQIAPRPVLLHRPHEEADLSSPLEPTLDLSRGGPMVPITVDDARALVLLAGGATAQEAADKSGVKLSYVMRLARGQGWSVHPTTGLASDERHDDGKPVVPDEVTALACQPATEAHPEPEREPEPEPAVSPDAVHGSVDELLEAARHLGDKKVTAALEKTETAIGKLRVVYEETEARNAAEKAAQEARTEALAEIERLKAQLAEAEKRAAEAGAKLRKTTAKPKPKPNGAVSMDAKVRAWARENGIDVPKQGRVSGGVLARYEAAHRAVAS